MKRFAVTSLFLMLATSPKAFANPALNHLNDYKCDVNEYTSEQSPESKLLKTFYVPPGTPVPGAGFHTGLGANHVVWTMTRAGDAFMGEVRNAHGEAVTISTVTDGQFLGIKVPGVKAVLSCHPPMSAGLNVVDGHVDPTKYGATIERFERPKDFKFNPQTYGESMTMMKLEGFDRIKPAKLSIRKLLELSSAQLEQLKEKLAQEPNYTSARVQELIVQLGFDKK